METSLMFPPNDFIDVLVLIVKAIVDALTQEVSMNLLNVITTLSEIKSKIDVIYNNTETKNVNDKYMSSLKDETYNDMTNLINDLRAIHRERRGLEINAWRM